MAICERVSILIDRQMHSCGMQVENRPLIMRSERWLAMWPRNLGWETKIEVRSISTRDIAVR